MIRLEVIIQQWKSKKLNQSKINNEQEELVIFTVPNYS